MLVTDSCLCVSVCLFSAQWSRERMQSLGPVPSQPDQRAAEERRHPGGQVESPQRAVQRGPLEQDGGTKLRLQDGAPHGRTDSLSLDTSSICEA